MAFPTGWTRSCALTIQHGQVPADQSSFPVLLTAACLPNEMLTTGDPNAAQSNGGDIRFSTDSGGTNQLACEIVLWTQNASPASAKAEIWVPVNLLTAADVTIYVWYAAGGGLSQPAASAGFGSQAVWDSNFKAVYHYPDGTTLSMGDSTSNANNGTNNSSVGAVAGKVDGGANFSGSNWMSKTDNTGLRPSVLSLSFWIKTSQTGNTVVIEKDTNNGFSVQIATNISLGIKINVGGSNAALGINTTHYTPDGNWHHIGFLYAASSLNSPLNHALIDGVDHPDTNDCGAPFYSTGDFMIGGRGSFAGTAMQMDEVRLSNSTRATTWIQTEYNNQSAPASFTVAGTPGAPGGGGGVGLLIHPGMEGGMRPQMFGGCNG